MQLQHADPDFLINEIIDFEDDLMTNVGATFRIGLLIPMCGSAGIWGPSCISSAQIAVAELNEAGGIEGKSVELIMIDSAIEAPTPVEEIINSLIEIGAINAIVGMHISAVRQNLSKIVRQRVPYVYTPLYEGGECTKGVFAIGDTPEQQLGPAIEYFNEEKKIKRWALIGNDYVWPRASNGYAKTKLKEYGAQISIEHYLPFGLSDMKVLLDELERSDTEAVLISLVGQDAITFNRAFGEAGLHSKMLRFSCAIEENGLLACGAENLIELYSASSYFGSLKTSANQSFREKYHNIHGDSAPVLNALGQSTYEGVHFLSGLLTEHHDNWMTLDVSSFNTFNYRSVRRINPAESAADGSPIYLAKAEGVLFRIIKKL